MDKSAQPGPLSFAALTLVAGFGIGWMSSNLIRGTPSNESATTANDEIKVIRCECGFDLTGISPEHVDRHRSGRQHQYNLHRSSGAPILVTGKINEYRSAISAYVLPSDVILEVGCAEGLTTQRLAQRCRVAIGIDQNEALIAKGNARLATSSRVDARIGKSPNWSNLRLHAGDGFDVVSVIRIVDEVLGKDNGSKKNATKHGGKVNKIWLDISGSRKADTVVQMVRILEALLEPDLIVVKSHHLKNLILRSHLPNSDIPGLPSNQSVDTSYILA